MNYFGQDGPEAIANAKNTDANKKSEESQKRYFQHFMVDFIEFNLRKVAFNNIQFCTQRCGTFSNIMDEDLTIKE